MAATDTVTRTEFDELRSDVAAIKETLDNHVLSTLAAHGESLEGLQDEVHHVKDGVDAIKNHFGI